MKPTGISHRQTLNKHRGQDIKFRLNSFIISLYTFNESQVTDIFSGIRCTLEYPARLAVLCRAHNDKWRGCIVSTRATVNYPNT